MNTRTILLAVAGIAVIGGAAFLYQEDIMNLISPPPKPAAKAMPAKPAAEAPKPAPTPPQAEAPKPAPAAPMPTDPAAMDRAIKETQARVGQLEKEQGDLLRQINEKDKQISAAEKKAAGK